MLRTKSVHSPIKPRTDGLRILTTRFRGHGLPASRYQCELFEGGPLDRRNATIKNHGQMFSLRPMKEWARRGPVTLLCHCAEDEQHCHRHVLQRVLRSKV
jgi:uncharacterized protein YeaO (DUF488 family)